MEAEKELISRGYSAVNPCMIDGLPLSRSEYLMVDMMLLDFCDAIYMLTNWEDSEGAKAELKRAEELGLEIMYEGEN